MSWKDILAVYSAEDQEKLEHAASVQADRVEKAALDLSCTGVVDGIDIGELWFAVVRRREELAGGAPEPEAPEPEPVVEEAAPEPPEQEPAATEPAEEPKPKRAPRAKKAE